jgi:hypothetical protein
MKRTALAVIAGLLLASAATAAAPNEPMTPIRQFVDGFNSGDTKTAFAAYAAGDIAIIDEFAPHRWVGPNAAHKWAAAYDKHAAAAGVSDGHVSYGEPTRIEVEAALAYVVVPTVYTYKERGKAMVEEGQMTFALRSGTNGWKIAAWTWTGVKPHAPG